MPVGRVMQLYMYPVSFIEFLAALGHNRWTKSIISGPPLFEALHEKLLELVGAYLAIGGMPEAVVEWIETKKSREVKRVQGEIIGTYRQDFGTYARKHENKYLSRIFRKAGEQLSRKFMYARVGEYRKRELEPAVDLLEMAGVVHKVIKTSGQGVPLGTSSDSDDFKLIFLDVGLTQRLLKYNLSEWFLNPLKMFVNKGELVEAFVGQELLAYSDPVDKELLFYWKSIVSGLQAEVDYLIQLDEQIVPIEVKAGISNRLKSMHTFLNLHPRSAYGIRLWAGNELKEDAIRSYPLYAIVKPLLDHNEVLRDALEYLVE